jgi:phosphatidate cytidylyltransferase
MAAANQTQPPQSKAAIFLRRASSAAVLWTIVLVALFSPYKLLSNYLFLGTMIWLTWAGLAEFYNLTARRDLVSFRLWGITGGILLTAITFFSLSGMDPAAGDLNHLQNAFLALFTLALCLRQLFSSSNPSGLLAISTTLLGLLYVPWLLSFMQKIYFFPEINGRFYLFYFILVTKFSDMGAYIVGSLIGRHKMFPRISPGKTWEGFGGAILFSAGASVGFAYLARIQLAPLTLAHAGVLGILLGGAAVLGDLVESLFKREASVKDSGRLFPGIGGILDLLDSLLFNAPLMYLYLRHVLSAGAQMP